MRNLLNLSAVILLCMLSLFFTQLDIQFMLALLCAVILCCLCFLLENRIAFSMVALCFFAVSVFIPAFLSFYPVSAYCLFSKRLYGLLAAGGGLFCFLSLTAGHPPFLLFLLEALGFFFAILLAWETGEGQALRELLKNTQDDSAERDLLLTEKNRSLLENQDYEIYTATLKERNRIAREIHDNVGHLLSRSILLTGAAKTVNKSEALSPTLDSLDATLNSAMDSIRKSVHDLRDEAVNLDDTVRSLIKDFTFCPVSYLYDAGHNIPKDIKYSFISIIKEALSNIIRHSDATQVTITLREHPAMYQLCVEDNGMKIRERGADQTFRSSGGGMGLANIQERVEKLSGYFHIFTENGFKILITIPKEAGK